MFVPPDIPEDMYEEECDNPDWQEFLKEFAQPMCMLFCCLFIYFLSVMKGFMLPPSQATKILIKTNVFLEVN